MSGFVYYLQNGNFTAAFAFIFAAITAIVLHELGHGYAAIKFGDMTPKLYHRMTLNPVHHFDLLGFLMFAFVGFGWAKPVPINPRNFSNFKKGMFFVSIAGVTINLCLAFIATPLIIMIEQINTTNMATFPLFLLTLSYYFLFFLKYISLVLFVFNLIPIAPLDGYRLVETFSKPYNKYTMFMRKNGQYVLIGFIALSYILASSPLNFSIIGTLRDWVASPIDWFWNLIFGLFN